MNEFQIHNKKYSKVSLHKNDYQKYKMKSLPQGLKNIFIANPNGLEISSQFGNYHYSKKNMFDENYNFRHITYNNSNNKNLSFPINTTSSNKNINSKYGEGSLIKQKNNLFKKKFEKYNSKKDESSNYYNSKENTNYNINIMNSINGIMLNKGNLKINIIPKKSNFKFISLKENNISLNSNKNIGKSVSKSKSKSKSKNKRENKSYNNKINNNINKIIFDKYLKLYKIGEKGFGKKNNRNKLAFLNKDFPYSNLKYSNEINNSDIYKIGKSNVVNNIQLKGLKKKNKSSNLLISNINKPKNMHTSNTNSNIIISRIESNNNTNIKIKNNKNNHKVDNNNKNTKKYLTENHIMYLINKKANYKKRNGKNNKEKQISLKDVKNNSNTNTNTNNNNSNNYINNYFNEKKHNNENQENIIYDYAYNNLLNNKVQNNNIYKNSKKNLQTNIDNENIYKMLNERLKTEYNDNSMEAIDKMYEEENTEELNQKSVSLSKHDSFRFLYPEIYNRDDEYYIENENNDSNDKKEKELDETESPLKMDTDKVNNENSGVLSFDQVKDIICYYNMDNTDKQNDFLFKKNERQIYDINYKNKYLNFFFGNNMNKNNNNDNINKDLNDDIILFNSNINHKYPNNSIFSVDIEYSNKMNKK